MVLPSKEFDEESRYHYVTVVIVNWAKQRHLPHEVELDDLIQEGAIAFERKWSEGNSRTICAIAAISAAIDELRRKPEYLRRNRTFRVIKTEPLYRRNIQLNRPGFRTHISLDSTPSDAELVEDPTDYFGFDFIMHEQLVNSIQNLTEREQKILYDWLNHKKGVQTAKELGISQGRVTQIRNKIFSKIRQEIT